MLKREKIYSATLLLLFLAVLLFTASCGADSPGNTQDQAASGAAENYGEGSRILPPESPKSGGVGDSAVRYRILTGSMELTVPHTRHAAEEVKAIATSAGGVISDSNLYTAGEDLYYANITLRVPENQFEAVMEQLKGLGKYDRVQSGELDVTEQYVDMEARLNTLQAQEVRYLEILEKATNVEEILNVERELGRIRADIESLTAMFNHLRDQVRYSTINL